MSRRRRKFRGRKRKNFVTVSQVKKLLEKDKETKHYDYVLNNDTTAIAGTSYISYLTRNRGSNPEDESLRCMIKSIQIKGHTSQLNAVTFDTQVRFILFRAGDTNGATPTVADLLVADDVDEIREWNNRQEYKVYWDKSVVLKTNGSGDGPLRELKYYKRFKAPKKLVLNASAFNVGSCESGGWFLIIMTNQVNTLQPTTSLRIRVTFNDV